jgi:hypothetical protein
MIIQQINGKLCSHLLYDLYEDYVTPQENIYMKKLVTWEGRKQNTIDICEECGPISLQIPS